MTDQERPLCDCPEPCGCYAEGYAVGKDKAYFEIEMALQDDTHAASCGCQPCRIKRTVLETMGVASSSATLGDHDNRNWGRPRSDRSPGDAGAPSDASRRSARQAGRCRRPGRREGRGPQLGDQHQARLHRRLESLHQLVH